MSIPLPLLLAIGGAGAAVLVIGVIVVGVIWTAGQTPEQNVAEANSGLPNHRVVPEVRGGGQAHQFDRMNRRDAASGDSGVPAQPIPGVADGDRRADPRRPQQPPERSGKPPQSKDGQPGPGAGTPGAVEDQSEGSDQAPGMGPGSLDWYTAGGRLRGAREVPDQDLVIYHYSWLCEVLPHLGQQEVYDQFDFKKRCIDSPNTRPSRTLIPQFLNPADQRQRLDDIRFPGFALTHFAGMSGVEDAPNDLAAEYPRSDPRAGIFGYDDVAKPSEITDGMSNTIMLIGTGKLAAPWVIGGGATVRGARPPYFGKHNGFGSVGLAQRGTISMMADGTIRHLSAEIEPEVFKALCTTHGAEEVDLNSSRIGPPAPEWYQP